MDHLRQPSPAPPHRQRSKSINPTADATTYPVINPLTLQNMIYQRVSIHSVENYLLRMVMNGPSGSGKGILLQNIILDIYRDCFERIFIWSPSINVDDNWKPVKNI